VRGLLVGSTVVKREDLMARTRAARAYTETARTDEHLQKLKMAAFMAIFHPEKKL
jgi:hypothetical protein